MSDRRPQILPAEETSLPSSEVSPNFYKDCLDRFRDGVYFVDTTRRITYWNQGAEQLTGYAAREVIGRHCFDNFLLHVNEQGCALCLNGCPLASTIDDGAVGHQESGRTDVQKQNVGAQSINARLNVSPTAKLVVEIQ